MATPVSNFSDSTPEEDGPVLALINKRLRNLRKKLNRISQLEETVAQGKSLNKEQDELLHSKPSVLAAIDELEKMCDPLLQALGDEIQLYLGKIGGNPEALVRVDIDRISSEDDCASAASELLSLLYFGDLFNRWKPPTPRMTRQIMIRKMLERNRCIAGDSGGGGAALKEQDLDMIALMRNLMVLPRRYYGLQHRDALQKCVEHAKLWFAKSEQPIDPNSAITYAASREKLNKIMTSDYFTKPLPDVRSTVEAAAVGGNDARSQVPELGPVASPSSSTIAIEGSAARFSGEEGGPNSSSTVLLDSHEEA